MAMFGLPQGREVGFYLKNLQQAIKDCEIDDTREAAIKYLMELAASNGLQPVEGFQLSTEPQ